MRGMGPDGRRLEGAEYSRFILQQALLTRKGDYPMRGDLGSELHERLGDPTTPRTLALAQNNVADVFDQLGGDLRYTSCQVTAGDRSMHITVNALRSETGQAFRLDGIEVE